MANALDRGQGRDVFARTSKRYAAAETIKAPFVLHTLAATGNYPLPTAWTQQRGSRVPDALRITATHASGAVLVDGSDEYTLAQDETVYAVFDGGAWSVYRLSAADA